MIAEILNLELMLELVKIWRDIGIGVLNIFCMWEGHAFGGPERELYWVE